MRLALAFATLSLVPASARAGEDTVRVVELAEWRKTEATVRRSASTTLEKIERILRAAKGVRVRHRGKIFHVKPSGGGPRRLEVQVVDVHSTVVMGRTFVFRSEFHDQVSKWKRWDRVSWLSMVDVGPDGRVTFDPIFRTPADLYRKPNPGPEARPPAKRTGSSRQLVAWIKRYASVARTGDMNGLWRVLKTGQKKAWIVRAEVLTVAKTGPVQVRLLDKLWLQEKDRKGRIGAMWGEMAFRKHVFVTDRQFLEVLHVGSTVELLAEVTASTTLDAFKRERGRFQLTYQFWRLAKK